MCGMRSVVTRCLGSWDGMGDRGSVASGDTVE